MAGVESNKESAYYAEHVLDLFAEIMHDAITVEPLRQVGSDITPALAQGLQFILRHGVCSVRDIAQGMSMTYSAASQLTDRLVKKGLATRSENERDRRLSEIRLTDQGVDLVERIRRERIGRIAAMLGKMSPDRGRILVETLEEFIAAAIGDGRSALKTCAHCGKDHIAECIVNEVYRAATGMQIQRT
mgnify:CR=1 FL=1